jgi:hypothetical protein
MYLGMSVGLISEHHEELYTHTHTHEGKSESKGTFKKIIVNIQKRN